MLSGDLIVLCSLLAVKYPAPGKKTLILQGDMNTGYRDQICFFHIYNTADFSLIGVKV